jgi:hypothetical protein
VTDSLALHPSVPVHTPTTSKEATMHRFENLKHGLAAALISLTVALVALALPLAALADGGGPLGS